MLVTGTSPARRRCGGVLRRVRRCRARCSWPACSPSPGRRRSGCSSASSPSCGAAIGQRASVDRRVSTVVLLAVIFVGMAALDPGDGSTASRIRRDAGRAGGSLRLVGRSLALVGPAAPGRVHSRAAPATRSRARVALARGRRAVTALARSWGLRNRRAVPLARRAAPSRSSDFRQHGDRRGGARLAAGRALRHARGRTTDALLVAVLAEDDTRRAGRLTSTLVGDRYPALTPDCPQVHAVRAGDRGAVRRPAGGPSVAQARSAGIRRTTPMPVRSRRGARPRALPVLPDRRGSRSARGGGGAGARRHHRARPLPVPGARRGGALPRDHARLPAPRRGAAARDRGRGSGRCWWRSRSRATR